jgi:hypothetical protein
MSRPMMAPTAIAFILFTIMMTAITEGRIYQTFVAAAM